MVTTREATETGSVVDVEGVLSFDFDLGSGYRYPVIIKDAKLSPGGTPDPDTPGDPG